MRKDSINENILTNCLILLEWMVFNSSFNTIILILLEFAYGKYNNFEILFYDLFKCEELFAHHYL